MISRKSLKRQKFGRMRPSKSNRISQPNSKKQKMKLGAFKPRLDKAVPRWKRPRTNSKMILKSSEQSLRKLKKVLSTAQVNLRQPRASISVKFSCFRQSLKTPKRVFRGSNKKKTLFNAKLLRRKRI